MKWGVFLDKRNTGLLAVALILLATVICIVLFVSGAQQPDAGEVPKQDYRILISELCTKNETVIADNTGKYRDYIELYNPGEAVSLEGFTLTNGKATSTPLHIQLEAGEYRVVFLSSETTGFTLGASGNDCIQLLDPSGSVVAQANTVGLTEDQVMVYRNGKYEVSAEATPGFPNDSAGLSAFREGTLVTDAPLLITELLLGNAASLPDEKGIYSDVVELYNASAQEIMLSDYFLSDDLRDRFAYRLPDVALAPDAYLVIYCDGEGYISEAGHIHANFALSFRESLCLTHKSGSYQAVAADHPGDDISLLRAEDGSFAPGSVSLGFPNTEAGSRAFYQTRINQASELVISEVLLSSAGVPYNGSFCDAVEITNISGETVSTAGWYLSDGGDPYRYPLPELTLAPGECTVITCSVQTTGFALSDGEVLCLTGPDHLYAPPVACTRPEPGCSITLRSEGSYGFDAVSLGYSNTAEGQAQFVRDQLPQALQISELMSANQSYLPGAYATTCDWIELYNGSSAEIQLSDYCLTDDSGNLSKYSLPDKVLAPGEYIVLFLSDSTANLRRGYSVLPFSLSSEGETLYLSKNGSICDHVVLPAIPADTSYGRSDGSFAPLAKPTPEKENSAAAQISAAPTALTAQGSYEGVESLQVVLEGEVNIYYTTNCEEPTTGSKRYTGPITITKTTIFRVICQEEGKQPSQILDLSYILNENNHLPVVSVVTKPGNLFSGKEGIYVAGSRYKEKIYNFKLDWERASTVSLFEKDGTGFYAPCGLKIHGDTSRFYPKKSFSVMFRSAYGDSQLDYRLFGEEGMDSYEAFNLRSGGQDFYRTKMRDELISDLAMEYTEITAQKNRPVNLYLNGEYWGIYYIREKINEHFIAGNENVSPDTVTLTEGNGGSSSQYQELINYATTHDLRKQEYYDYVCSQVDIQQYMDYLIAEIWIGNTDNDNIRYYTYTGGKWRWILFDTDLSMISSNFDSVAAHLNPAGTGASDWVHTKLINALLKNPEFKEAFIRRMAWQMNNIWTPENVNAKIDEYVALIQPDMQRECNRWPEHSYKLWETYLGYLRSFANKRNERLTAFIKAYFNLSTAKMQEYGFIIE